MVLFYHGFWLSVQECWGNGIAVSCEGTRCGIYSEYVVFILSGFQSSSILVLGLYVIQLEYHSIRVVFRSIFECLKSISQVWNIK